MLMLARLSFRQRKIFVLIERFFAEFLILQSKTEKVIITI